MDEYREKCTAWSKRIKQGRKKKLSDQYLELVKLSEFKKAYPSQLSGGMSQRAAIARSLVSQPEILLLDEPFGALDALTKIELQEEMLKIRERFHNTMIMVTHDIEEAVFLADRIVVMSARPGRIKDVIKVELGKYRDRGSTDFTHYKRKSLIISLKKKQLHQNTIFKNKPCRCLRRIYMVFCFWKNV